jgi:hypothetical protein
MLNVTLVADSSLRATMRAIQLVVGPVGTAEPIADIQGAIVSEAAVVSSAALLIPALMHGRRRAKASA